MSMAQELFRAASVFKNQGKLIRWAGIAAAFVAGGIVDGLPEAQERLYVFNFLTLILASLFCSTWPLIAGAEIALGLAWLIVVRRNRTSLPARLIVDVNRTLGHIEVRMPWLVLTMLLPGPSFMRWGAAATLILRGATSEELLVRLWRQLRGLPEATAAQLQRERRVPMYFFTFVGSLLLLGLAPGQARAMLPSMLAVLVGMALRLTATWQGGRRDGGLSQRQWSATFDVLLGVLVLGVLCAGAWLLGRPNPQTEFSQRISAAACVAPPQGEPLISLTLLADTQFHELRGERSAAHLPMVDAVIPVAVRPVALDLLSGVTLVHFARLYRQYVAAHPTTQSSYAFLGDLADIGCSTEIERYPAYFARFEEPTWTGGRGHMAGLASGNHDNTFVGNFAWHPDWDPACLVPAKGALPAHGTRLDKISSDYALRDLVKRFATKDLIVPDEPLRASAAWIDGRSSLPMVNRLGELPGTPPRPVYGVFLDTGDSAYWQLGVAGSQGHVSQAQIDYVRARVPADAWVVLMLHHPLEQLGPWSRDRVGELATAWQERLLLVISAHTHRSALHFDTPLGNRTVAQFTIGSTTDPTQEMAILELRGTAQQPSAWVATIPAVTRPGMDCANWAQLHADTCEQALGDLATACPMLLEDDWRVSLHTPDEMTAHQRKLAEQIMACLGIDNRGDPLDPEAYTGWAQRNDQTRRKFVCLSWAASVLQGHKGDAWRYVDAVRCLGERSAALGGFSAYIPVQVGHSRP